MPVAVVRRIGFCRVGLALMLWGVLTCAASARTAWAGEAHDLDDILDGFEDEPPQFEIEPDKGHEVPAPRCWEVSGSIETSGSMNYRSHRSDTGTDYTGLQRLRNRLDLQLDWEIPRGWVLCLEGWAFYDAAYLLDGRRNYTRQVLDQYEWDADLGEAWIRGTLHEDIDLKVGRQVVIWGRSETLRVLDVLNPLDNREPGRVDLEDLRRPVGMLRIDGYTGNWTMTGLAIPEIRFDLNPVVGSDFFPGTFDPPEQEPEDFEDVELAGAATGIFRGWDISFHAAWYWNDQPRFRRAESPAVLVHDRLWLVGGGGNYTVGSWLLKSEIAFLGGLGFFMAGEKERLDTLLGVEYYGFIDTTIVLEGLNRHLFRYDRALRRAPDFTREDMQEIAFRITRDFLNDTLHFTGLGVHFGWDARDGAIIRFDLWYDLSDALEAGVGLLLYQSGDLPPLNGWGRNDRLICNLKWSF